MKTITMALASMLFMLTSCTSNTEVKAAIFERKELPRNRLLIRFRYQVNNEVYVDSAVVLNKIISSDSIHVIVNSKNPSKSLPIPYQE